MIENSRFNGKYCVFAVGGSATASAELAAILPIQVGISASCLKNVYYKCATRYYLCATV